MKLENENNPLVLTGRFKSKPAPGTKTWRFTARVTACTDRVGTIDRLESIARTGGPAIPRRIAGFDAVRLLDADG